MSRAAGDRHPGRPGRLGRPERPERPGRAPGGGAPGARRRAVLGAVLGAAPAGALALTGLAACGGAGPAAGGGPGAQPPVQIAFFFPNWGQPAIYEAKEQRKIDAFQQQTERVRVQAAPSPENYGPQLTALFAAGTPPETFFADHQV